MVLNNLEAKRKQGANYEDAQGDLDSLIIIDRNIGRFYKLDFITPLIT